MYIAERSRAYLQTGESTGEASRVGAWRARATRVRREMQLRPLANDPRTEAARRPVERRMGVVEFQVGGVDENLRP